jgi:hypothetical protein
MREHARLAAASTGQDQQWTLAVIDRCLLGWIEPCHGY